MIRNCPACGKANRIPARHLSDTGRCGSCKSPLPPLNEPLDVDDNAFAQIVAEAKVPILTDFWAEWCGPCRMAAPEVHELAREMAGKALVLKVNTEEHPQVAAQIRRAVHTEFRGAARRPRGVPARRTRPASGDAAVAGDGLNRRDVPPAVSQSYRFCVGICSDRLSQPNPLSA